MSKHIRKSRSKGIAETYIHVKYDVLHKKSYEEIEYYLETNAREWAKNYFKEPVNIGVRVEEGSIIAWVTVAGSLYAMVASYGSFRSGIDFLVKDAKAFSSYVIEQFYQDEQIPVDDIIRDERRLGVPGKILRLLKQSDKINNDDVENRGQLIDGLTDECLEIIILLEDDRDRELFIENIPNELAENLPDPLPLPLPIHEEIFLPNTLIRNIRVR